MALSRRAAPGVRTQAGPVAVIAGFEEAIGRPLEECAAESSASSTPRARWVEAATTCPQHHPPVRAMVFAARIGIDGGDREFALVGAG